MRIVDVVTVPGRTGFFADDQAAIRAAALHDGFGYVGEPLTPGFLRIRQPGESLSVLLVLGDGSVVFGDCAAVQYSGAGGRDPVFSADAAAAIVAAHVTPLLIDRELTAFREVADEIEGVRILGTPLHTAIRYGVSQALLAAVAQGRRVTMAEVIRDEYSTGIDIASVPLYAQTGDDRHGNAEKMIVKTVDVLPHALINAVDGKLGQDGEVLEAYLAWLVSRIEALRPTPDYSPRIHIDTYGTVGLIFDGDVERAADYLAGLGRLVAPYPLTVEHPIDAGSRDAQIETYVALRRALAARASTVKLAVDEWCNTLDDIRAFVDAGAADVIHVKTPDLGGIGQSIEALLLVREAGYEAYCGGTCNETDRSAQVSAHVAMACGATQVLAKPGMGVDEGLMIVGNEMARTEALIASRLIRK
ncbi:methylaspartate ammonia-lyase [Frondihabitans sp. PAMC 28766]|uniref:methylaspartate ammonia-lyase n=1 Tax=Frondihabitans sp. PAMC 28766 TaxID=1795630 RepID=UPI00078C93CF|nr:methylaspartate ammonia-lyase [Frondihabitans sp. PAMC 28766]AMM21643.1 methylaspartate ammonia-lyase [Frondihabitans sp. PAMC 28766]